MPAIVDQLNAMYNGTPNTAVQRTMCTDFTMAHSQILFRKFWTANNGVLAPNLPSTALDFQQRR